MNSLAGAPPEGDIIMSGSFFASALGQASANNREVRDELRKAKHLKTRIKQAAAINADYLYRQRASVTAPETLRAFLDRLLERPIVHAVWDDPSVKSGIGTRLLKGEGLVYDRLMGRPSYEIVKEATIRVPDEEAARWIQAVCGGPGIRFQSNALPAPEGMPYLAIVVEHAQPDGTTVREIVRTNLPNWTND